MRGVAAVLAVVVAGCSSGVVPLDADGGGTPPSSCEPVFTDATRPEPWVGVLVSGVRTLTVESTLYCRPDAMGGLRYTCTFDSSLHAPDVRIVVRWRSAPPTSPTTPARQGVAFDIERVHAPNAEDSSAWGGNLVLTPQMPDASGIEMALSGPITFPDPTRAQACSAAGSSLTIRDARAYFCARPDCS